MNYLPKTNTGVRDLKLHDGNNNSASSPFTSTITSILLTPRLLQRYVYWPMLYRPVVDAGLRDEPFLPEPVESLAARPPLRPAVPLLLGGVPKEGLLYALSKFPLLFLRSLR